MTIISRNAIVASQDIETAIVAVPEWGGDVCVRAINGRTQAEFAKRVTEAQDKGAGDLWGLKLWLVAQCLVDENGARLFADGEESILAEKSAKVINRIADRVMELGGMTEDSQKEVRGN